MSRRSKAILLVALLAGVVICVRIQALRIEPAWLFRVLTIALGLGGWFVSQSLIKARGGRDGAIGDALHDWTAPLHGWLARTPRAANALLVTSSAFIDLFGVFLLGFALFGPTLRPGIALLLLFAFRQMPGTCGVTPPPGLSGGIQVCRPVVTYDVATIFLLAIRACPCSRIEAAKIAPVGCFVAGAIASERHVRALRAHITRV